MKKLFLLLTTIFCLKINCLSLNTKFKDFEKKMGAYAIDYLIDVAKKHYYLNDEELENRGINTDKSKIFFFLKKNIEDRIALSGFGLDYACVTLNWIKEFNIQEMYVFYLNVALEKSLDVGELNFAQKMINLGAIINPRDNLGRLHICNAVFESNPKKLEFLIKNGLNINEKDKFGRTSFSIFCEKITKIAKEHMKHLSTQTLSEDNTNLDKTFSVSNADAEILYLLLLYGDAESDMYNRFLTSITTHSFFIFRVIYEKALNDREMLKQNMQSKINEATNLPRNIAEIITEFAK